MKIYAMWKIFTYFHDSKAIKIIITDVPYHIHLLYLLHKTL